tara:strand:+ start:124 stop:303 length:180 start_codon:yes stop_codon:yes gene_type:complete
MSDKVHRNKGSKRSDETKRKMSEAKKQVTLDEWLKGSKMSEEEIEEVFDEELEEEIKDL